MLNFLKVLIFGTWVSLTPEPVDLVPPALEIVLEDPISALTPGAHLRIDISQHITGTDVISKLDQAKEFMASECLTAELFSAEGKVYSLDYLYQSTGKDTTELVLARDGGVPVDTDFVKVVIESCKPVSEVVIKWSNFKM